MATTAELVKRTRRFLRDFSEFDVLTASVASSGTTLTVANEGLYAVRDTLEIDQEAFRVTGASDSGTSLEVRGAQYGTTAASHANGSAVLRNPAFFSIEILDALNEGIDACWPMIYKEVVEEDTTADGEIYEFDIPATISRLSAVEGKPAGLDAFQPYRSFRIVRGASPKIAFTRAPDPGLTLRLRGYGPFDHLTFAGSTDSQWPAEADGLLPLYAAACLLDSGEAGRARADTGLNDARESAQRPGSSSALARGMMQRFYARLDRAALPPLPKHVQSVI